MSLEQNFHQHHREPGDKYVDPNADYEMSEYDYVVRPSAQGAGPITITLPPVAKARGRLYSIIVRAASAVNTVTIADQNDSECWLGDIVFNGKCDRVLLYSDGLAWIALGEMPAWPGLSTTRAPGTATATTAAPTTAAPTTLATTAAPTTA